jgi:3-isopropylmalate/(R)-2-methylmalate dehydratase large subunit
MDISLPGRILFLSTDPELVRSQLAGRNLTPAEAGTLREDVSTDEMTSQVASTVYDQRLGDFLLTAFQAGGVRPIGRGAVKNGEFSVIVGGKRYGKGSSREHSPLAHLHAGIRLIVANSFERIFRQNCDNLGIFTSTDLGLPERLQRGDTPMLDELVAGREPLAAELLRAGGLLKYGGSRGLATGASRQSDLPQRPLTLVEKILLRHAADDAWPLTTGAGSFVRTDWRFAHEYYTAMISQMIHAHFGRPAALHDPATTLLFEDHLTYAHRSPVHLSHNLLPAVRGLSHEHQTFAREYGLRNHGYLPDWEGSEAICHAMMTERYALPGQVVVGTDSHTTHIGALGCLAFGVGSTDMANCFVKGVARLTVPESILVRLKGALPAGVCAKDVALVLLAREDIKSGAGLGRVFEFVGTVVQAMDIDERATLTNMVAEMGGFTGIVAPDARTTAFLKERRGVDFAIESWMQSDPGASYAAEIALDCSDLTPMVAAPPDPGRGIPLAELAERPMVHIAYGGSCTAGKREDFDQYHTVLAWAAERGLTVPDGLKLYLQFGTLAVQQYCVERGYLKTFDQVGAAMLAPGCGACAGGGPGSSSRADEVTVSAINRNFPGRSGPGQVWLASPATVAASAIAGELVSFDELKTRFAARTRAAVLTT